MCARCIGAANRLVHCFGGCRVMFWKQRIVCGDSEEAAGLKVDNCGVLNVFSDR